jgi:hypothetical protein
MCQYFKRLHTCGCLSRAYLERCRSAIIKSEKCSTLEDPSDFKEDARPSYFACYECLIKNTPSEQEKQREAEEKIRKVNEEKAKQQRQADRAAKTESLRRAAAAKAAAEREEDQREKEARKAEMERAKKEGGLWIDAAGSRKKGRRGGGEGSEGPASPISAPPVGGINGRRMGEFMKETDMPRSASVIDPGGRAGVWPPRASPKKNNGRNSFGK